MKAIIILLVGFSSCTYVKSEKEIQCQQAIKDFNEAHYRDSLMWEEAKADTNIKPELKFLYMPHSRGGIILDGCQ